LIGYSYPGQIFKGVRANSLFWVNHRESINPLRRWLVVIGDNKIQAQTPGELGFLSRRDAAVNTDD
jgi:hypothetical protein